jgi:hypothetical protein
VGRDCPVQGTSRCTSGLCTRVIKVCQMRFSRKHQLFHSRSFPPPPPRRFMTAYAMTMGRTYPPYCCHKVFGCCCSWSPPLPCPCSCPPLVCPGYGHPFAAGGAKGIGSIRTGRMILALAVMVCALRAARAAAACFALAVGVEAQGAAFVGRLIWMAVTSFGEARVSCVLA